MSHGISGGQKSDKIYPYEQTQTSLFILSKWDKSRKIYSPSFDKFYVFISSCGDICSRYCIQKNNTEHSQP